MNLSGKTALITGASAGIGLEFASQLHREEVNLVLTARREERLKELCEKLNHVRPGSARMIVCDLENEASLRTLAEEIQRTQIDILVNNAGRGSFGAFDALPLQKEVSMVALNVTATITLVHAVLPQMKSRKEGIIVSLSSIAGFQPLPYMATYAATKAFNLYHSLALRYELASFGIKVVTVCPGPTETEFGTAAEVPGERLSPTPDRVSDVVAESIRAMKRNAAFVVPGVRSKLMSLASRLLPRVISTWSAEKLLRNAVRK